MTEAAERPSLHETAATGPWGGPVYAYRGPEIRCAKDGHVCSLFMEGHPLHGHSVGVVGTITPLVDRPIHIKQPGERRGSLAYKKPQQSLGARPGKCCAQEASPPFRRPERDII